MNLTRFKIDGERRGPNGRRRDDGKAKRLKSRAHLDKAVTARRKNERRKKHRKLRLERYMPSMKRCNRAQIAKALD